MVVIHSGGEVSPLVMVVVRAVMVEYWRPDDSLECCGNRKMKMV